MKKVFFATTMILGAFFAKAQHVEFGLKGGVNSSKVKVKDVASAVDSRTSFHVGGLAHIHVSDHFAVQPELTFSGQGYKREGTGNNADQFVALNYINLPVLLQYMTKSGFRIETGPQVGALVSADYKEGAIDANIKSDYKTLDVSWAFGLGYITPSGFGVDARYNLGLSNIRENTAEKYMNRVFQAGVFYQFKPTKRK